MAVHIEDSFVKKVEELGVNKMGYNGYNVIVWDNIKSKTESKDMDEVHSIIGEKNKMTPEEEAEIIREEEEEEMDILENGFPVDFITREAELVRKVK